MCAHKIKRWVITGPGLLKAVQEAVNAGKDIVTVYDSDPKTGEIIRVGYFLVDRGKKVDWKKADTKRIDKSEWTATEEIV